MSNKHDANVRKSTLVNFQIGLIASLLFTYVMFEVYTAVPVVVADNDKFVMDEPPLEWNPNFKVHVEPKAKTIVEKQSKPVVDPQVFKVVEDLAVLKDIDNVFKNSPPTEAAPINPDEIDSIEPVDEPISVPFTAVEHVPVFPGCEHLATNREKAACFSEKIRKIVSKKFNTGLGERYGLAGLQRIYTLFEVSPAGVIQNVQIRAPHPGLEKEARRVVSLFPKVTPGKQRGRAVTVKYQLPIVFKIAD